MKAIHKKYYIPSLFLLFLAVWVWSWWHPADPRNWFLENELVFLSVPIVLAILWYIRLSKLSITLVILFLMMHVVGSHYNYGSVPFGNTVGQIFGANANEYDKVVHFSFGFLIVYPIRELTLRVARIKYFWGYVIPFLIIMTFSALYEIREWFAVINLDPHAGYLFIGGNDPFDTQKDMFMAGLGALLAILIVGFIEERHNKNFWQNIKHSFYRDKRTFPKEDMFLHTSIP